MAYFNQWRHNGERRNNKVIVSNLGFPYDEKTKKQKYEGTGYLVICACGHGFLIPYYTKIKNGEYHCPYCGR